MPPRKSFRKEIKEPDWFQVFAARLLEVYVRNKTKVYSLLVLIVLGIAGFWGYTYNQGIQSLRMETLYFEMQKIRTETKGKNSGDVSARMNKILADFNEGVQKQRASLLVADAFYEEKQYDSAISIYSEVIKKSQPGQLIYDLAKEGLAHSFEGKKDFPQAINTYKSIIDGKSSLPLFYIYLGLARSHELNKAPKNAILVLRDIKNKFPNHADIDRVDMIIHGLEGTT